MTKVLAFSIASLVACLMPTVALANQPFYWSCISQTECKDVEFWVQDDPHQAPVDISIACQDSQGSYPPWWLGVSTPQITVTCSDSGTSGFYAVATCQGTVKLKKFKVKVHAKCLR